VSSGSENVSKPQLEQVNRQIESRKGLTITRFRVAQSYRPIFEGAGQRIVEREAKNLRKEIKKHLGERSLDTFKVYLADFYRDFPEYIIRQIKPVAYALAGAIEPLAQEQIGTKGQSNIDKFIDEYAKAFAYRYTKSSQGQILALLDELDAEEFEDGIGQRLTEWEETRPGKIGMNETVQLSNAVAKTVFAGSGMQMLVWRNTSAKSCPYCEEMDGRKVAIDQDFLGHDTKLDAEGIGTLKVYRPCAQPPLHEGCQCQLEPG